jgi:hypothetical protein
LHRALELPKKLIDIMDAVLLKCNGKDVAHNRDHDSGDEKRFHKPLR